MVSYESVLTFAKEWRCKLTSSYVLKDCILYYKYVVGCTGMKEHIMLFFRNIGMHLIPRSIMLFPKEVIVDPRHDV